MNQDLVSLLSVSEAAKLLGVCENTLRDWDNEGKFKAFRTEGNHRRYSLKQIREYLDENPPEPEKPDRRVLVKDTIFERWRYSEYLVDRTLSLDEKKQLAVLLDNCRLHHTSANTMFEEGGFPSLKDSLWLTQQIFLRCQFRKLVSVQPMLGPAHLVYYTKKTDKGISIQEEAIAAKTYKLEVRFFDSKYPFSNFAEAYADTIAHELDLTILQMLPKIENIDNLLMVHMAGEKVKLLSLYDYIIAPENTIKELEVKTDATGVTMYPTPATLDPNTFLIQAYGGRFPASKLELPIFAPYILFYVGPSSPSNTRFVLSRYGYYDGK